jgi:hypothetical protein
MMTKKREMAEWILDFFRRAKVDAGQIVMMRSVQNKLIELNPKERDLFVPVANELIEHGYFSYEEGSPQVLRLADKGRDYIYSPDAELDCCNDDKLTPSQARYIENWYDSFAKWVNGVLGIIESLSLLPTATEEDKRGLHLCKTILNGYEVGMVEQRLSEGKVTNGVLNRIEELNKRLVDTILEHLKTDAIMKEFMKQICYLRIEQEKDAEEMRLGMLRIPVGEE